MEKAKKRALLGLVLISLLALGGACWILVQVPSNVCNEGTSGSCRMVVGVIGNRTFVFVHSKTSERIPAAAA